jgi:hypothetical protein
MRQEAKQRLEEAEQRLEVARSELTAGHQLALATLRQDFPNLLFLVEKITKICY